MVTIKPSPLPKLTDEQRLERFKAMARKVAASEDPEDFERAFERVIAPHPAKTKKP